MFWGFKSHGSFPTLPFLPSDCHALIYAPVYENCRRNCLKLLQEPCPDYHLRFTHANVGVLKIFFMSIDGCLLFEYAEPMKSLCYPFKSMTAPQGVRIVIKWFVRSVQEFLDFPALFFVEQKIISSCSSHFLEGRLQLVLW